VRRRRLEVRFGDDADARNRAVHRATILRASIVLMIATSARLTGQSM
jgi:hypothetical protein